MFKFIHIGDVHLDTTFYSKDNNTREKLRNSLRESFQQVINTCIQEKVHGLLIAGDLFDNNQLSFQTEEMLLNSFKRLEAHHIKVFYATGNHDPGDSSLKRIGLEWPKNVTVFSDDKIKVIDVLDEGNRLVGKVVGVGHKNARESRNLIKDFPHKEEAIPHVGLVHTMITNAKGVDKHDRYLPSTIEDLQQKGYDYWALGHIHQYQEIGEDKNIYYSGNLQGRHPRETGEKGGLLVTINHDLIPRVQFISFSNIIWHTLSIDGLEGIKSYSQLKEHLIDEITNYFTTDLQQKDIMLRLELQGRSPLKEELNEAENLYQLQQDLKFYFQFLEVEVKIDNLLVLEDVEGYRDGVNVLAKTISLLDGLKDDEALLNRLALLSFANKKIKTTEDKLEYIMELSKGLKEEAVNRLVGDEK